MAYSMLSDVALSRDPLTSNHAATKNYVDLQDARYQTHNTTAPSSPAIGYLWTDTTLAPRYLLKQYNGSSWITISDTDASAGHNHDATYINVGGDTMTGELLLAGNPSNVLGATPKQYVDLRALASTTITTGGGLTGGGDLSTNRTFAVGAGTGITVNADDIAINRTVVDTWYAVAAHNHDASYVELAGDTMTGFLTLNADPSNPSHAATKQYVDITAQGLTFKQAVRVVATTAITLSGLQVVDNVSLVASDRVLVTNNAPTSQNGIYSVAAGAWTRAVDADASGEIKDGVVVPVAEGTLGADSLWICTTIGTNPWVVGSTSTWTRFTSITDLVAGSGLTKTGTQLDVGAGTGITLAADSISVDSTVVQFKSQRSVASGYASLDTGAKVPLGELPTGTTGTTVALGNHTHTGYVSTATTLTAGAGLTGGGDLTTNRTIDVIASSTGGLQVNADDIQIKLNGTTLQTNASGLSVLTAPKWTTTRNITLSGAVTGSATIDGSGDITIGTTGGGGAASRYSQNLTGGSTTEVVTHGLGTKDVSVTVYEIASGEEVGVQNARTTVNTVTLTFTSAPAASTYRVVVI